MNKKYFLIIIFGLIGLITSNAQPNEKIVIDNDIQLIHIQDSIFVHVTWHHLNDFGRFPSNGLILVKKGQALMIDTPIDDDKTERLTKYLKDSMSVDLTKLIIGHFHDDCLGGLGYLQSIGIESIANSMTVEKCQEIGLLLPSTSFTDSLTFNFNGEQIDCRYFGAGHSFDNITVWISNKKILFGGCLIKSVDSKGLGNLSDAVVNDWDNTIEKVMKRYPEIKTVIPGHGEFGGVELLTHTLELVDKEKGK
ncbi:subclass B1 metallo-beta-lactamase [Marinilabilia sp.]|uniref:subclass B1 metallo-beta-lactamase n=1 Tax=Marinilabilia sp. TaxID=2021252 RepID=UPI0025C1BC33|nr:subclass B1 metallo-beta-lactamase [Marinilabilia sp.]